jgi:deoxycytidylate deaminase
MKCLLEAARCGLSTLDSIVYVARPRRDGVMGLTAPCDACKHFLREAGVDSVFYTDHTSPYKYGEVYL